MVGGWGGVPAGGPPAGAGGATGASRVTWAGGPRSGCCPPAATRCTTFPGGGGGAQGGVRGHPTPPRPPRSGEGGGGVCLCQGPPTAPTAPPCSDAHPLLGFPPHFRLPTPLSGCPPPGGSPHTFRGSPTHLLGIPPPILGSLTHYWGSTPRFGNLCQFWGGVTPPSRAHPIKKEPPFWGYSSGTPHFGGTAVAPPPIPYFPQPCPPPPNRCLNKGGAP